MFSCFRVIIRRRASTLPRASLAALEHSMRIAYTTRFPATAINGNHWEDMPGSLQRDSHEGDGSNAATAKIKLKDFDRVKKALAGAKRHRNQNRQTRCLAG